MPGLGPSAQTPFLSLCIRELGEYIVAKDEPHGKRMGFGRSTAILVGKCGTKKAIGDFDYRRLEVIVSGVNAQPNNCTFQGERIPHLP